MHRNVNPLAREKEPDRSDLPAGDFSSWLKHAREALLTECGTDVACGECAACCSSSFFIHIRPEETQTRRRIGKRLLVAAPGLPSGHFVLGYDRNGLCPMLKDGRCSIYAHRPLTCRNYDCRVFAAAGIAERADGRSLISQRAKRLKFTYPTKHDLAEHAAVQAAARFILEHAACFPGGQIPTSPSQLAILAITAYDVFLRKGKAPRAQGRALSDSETANAIVETCRQFEEEKTNRKCFAVQHNGGGR